MSSASAAADVTDVQAIPQLPPATPIGLEVALGVQMSDSEALVARAADDEAGIVAMENDMAAHASLDMVTDAAKPLPRHGMCMPDFWHVIAKQNVLHSAAQARLVVSSALRLAAEQARGHGSFRMGPYVRCTRVLKSGTRSSIYKRWTHTAGEIAIVSPSLSVAEPAQYILT